MTALEIEERIKALHFPFGEYLVVGGGVLAMRGIRETHDMDILVSQALFQKLAKEWPEDEHYFQKWHRHKLKRNDIELYPDFFLEKQNKFLDTKVMIASADIINNFPLQPLDDVIAAKIDNGREKDLDDVRLIRTYQTERKYRGKVPREHVRDPNICDQFQEKFTATDIHTIMHCLKGPTSHAHFWCTNENVIVFQDRLFFFSEYRPDIYEAAMQHAQSLGIPADTLLGVMEPVSI